jgi:PAS domain S-box-containing protein
MADGDTPGAASAQAKTARDVEDRLLADAARVAALGGWRYDAASARVEWSAGVRAIFDAPDDYEPDFHAVRLLISPQDRDRHDPLVDECVRTGRPYDDEFDILTLAGARRRVRVAGRPRRCGDQLVGAFGLIEDVTRRCERNDSESALAHQPDATAAAPPPASLRDALIAAGDGFATFDAGGRLPRADSRALPGAGVLDASPRGASSVGPSDSIRSMLADALDTADDAILITEANPLDRPGPWILYANAAIERQTGWRPDEVVGRSPRIFQGPMTDRRALDRIRAALSASAPVDAALVNLRRDGRPVRVLLSITPLREGDGRVTRWLALRRELAEGATRADEA